MLLAQVLNVLRPTPAGHDVWIFQVVVVAASALRMYGAAMAAPAATPSPVFRSRRRVVSPLRAESSCMVYPPSKFLIYFEGNRWPAYFKCRKASTDRRPASHASVPG